MTRPGPLGRWRAPSSSSISSSSTMGSGGIRRSGISAPGPSSDGWITKHRQLNPGVYEIGASPEDQYTVICRFATLVSREQVTEDPVTKFERLGDGCSSALGRWVRVPPRSQMLFRPEEVDRRSERVEGFAPLVTALSEPDHHALGVRPHPLRRCGEIQRFAAVMAGGLDLDEFSDHWRNAERVGRAAGVTLATA